jgi:predicted dehydrogenase
MSNPIGIGVIGLGESGQGHVEVIQGDRIRRQSAPRPSPVRRLARAGKHAARYLLGRGRTDPDRPFDPGIEDLKIVAVSDLDPARRGWATEQYEIPHVAADYKILLDREDIEAVLICTPPIHHPEIVSEAACRGKHIFCEKPMAMTSRDCLDILDATEKAGVILQVGYMLRFASERGRIVDAIRNNEIGRPVFFRETLNLRAGGPQLWVHDQKLGGGPIWEMSHVIDFVRYVFGDPELVFGIGGRYKPERTSAIDTYAASLIFPSGDRALLGDSYALKGFGWEKDKTGCRPNMTQIDVIGPGGYMQFPDADLSQTLTICSYNATDYAEKLPWRSRWGFWGANGYKSQLEHFAECVRHKKTPKVSGAEGFRTILLAETILDSIQSGEVRKFGALP